jgi:hypothetical protein
MGKSIMVTKNKTTTAKAFIFIGIQRDPKKCCSCDCQATLSAQITYLGFSRPRVTVCIKALITKNSLSQYGRDKLKTIYKDKEKYVTW